MYNYFDENNGTIFDAQAKVVSVLQKHRVPVCSISGGSDSDIVLDMIHRADELSKTVYVWFNTGLEYNATKEHIKFLNEKYGIEIKEFKPEKPIPICCRDHGLPFVSKYVSECIERLQRHGFKWEDKPFVDLWKEYPKCKASLRWWCNDFGGEDKRSRFNINQNKWLKEFLIVNPPNFPVSAKCCEYSKKRVAVNAIKTYDADLDITGIRKFEGGIRSASYTSCFTFNKHKNIDTFRPIFYFKNNDKTDYEKKYCVVHSRCYTEYGLTRTGCIGCPFNRDLASEIEIVKTFEPNLYLACISIFGKSYEYTKKFNEFKKRMKENGEK